MIKCFISGTFPLLLKLVDNQQHTQHKFHQAKLKLSTEWIPVQVYDDKTDESNPLMPRSGLQMYQSKFEGLQGWVIKLFQGGVTQMYICM